MIRATAASICMAAFLVMFSPGSACAESRTPAGKTVEACAARPVKGTAASKELQRDVSTTICATELAANAGCTPQVSGATVKKILNRYSVIEVWSARSCGRLSQYEVTMKGDESGETDFEVKPLENMPEKKQKQQRLQ